MNEKTVFNIENLQGQQIPAEIVEQLKVLGRVTFPLKPTSVSAVSTSAEEESPDQVKAIDTISGMVDHVAGMEDLVEQLEDMIDQLTKNMNIPVTQGSALSDAIKNLGGDGSTITKEIFDKAQAIMDHAPIMTLGRDPFLDAAIGDGALNGPYMNCDEITRGVARSWNIAQNKQQSVEAALKDSNQKIAEDFEKSKNNMIIEILSMLWWNMLWPKFIVMLVIINPIRLVFANPFDKLACFFLNMTKTCGIGRFRTKPKACIESYGPINRMLNRLACILLCKVPKPLYKRYKPMVDPSSFKVMKNGKLVPCNCDTLSDCAPQEESEPAFDKGGDFSQLGNLFDKLFGEKNEPCVDTKDFISNMSSDDLKNLGIPPNCVESARVILEAVISDALTPSDPANIGITGSASISSILERQNNQLGG